MDPTRPGCAYSRSRVAESRMSVIAGESLRRGPSLASTRERSDSSGVTSSAVTRAIEDLKGSGYRPLHRDPTGPQRASISGYVARPASGDGCRSGGRALGLIAASHVIPADAGRIEAGVRS